MTTRVAGRAERGFSLIEAMVGLTLGVITVLIITQTFATFEASKSTTTAGADAQENGLVALDILSQEARNAGVGLTDNVGAWDCVNYFAWKDDGVNPSGPVPGFNTAPVTIADGGANGTDTITFRTGSSFLGAIPAYITQAMPQSSSELNINRTQGFKDGDLILVTQGGNCTVMQVTQVQPAALKLQHNPGNAPTFNPDVPYQNNNGWPAYTDGAKIYNMGNILTSTYSIDASRNLQLVSSGLTTPTQTLTLVREVVSLQAQYGVSNLASDAINAWTDATGAWAALDATEVKRIKAVRIVVVTRAGKREATAVTAAVPQVRTSPLDPTLVDVPGINTLPEWQNYRYKVYETVIPLRNVLWANLT